MKDEVATFKLVFLNALQATQPPAEVAAEVAREFPLDEARDIDELRRFSEAMTVPPRVLYTTV